MGGNIPRNAAEPWSDDRDGGADRPKKVDVATSEYPLGVDLTDPQTFADGIPHDVFARLRREAPVAWHSEATGKGFWSVTRHADVVDVNRETESMSSARFGNMIFDNESAEDLGGSMLVSMDPPQHTRYRRLVNRGFTPRMISRLEEFMEQIAARTLDRVLPRGEADFVEDVAAELPIQVIAHLMGVGEAERSKVFELSNRLIGFDDPEYGSGRGSAEEAGFEMYTIANKIGKEKREAIDAGRRADDIVTALLEAEVDGDRLSELEYDMFFLLLTVAGNETTRTAIAQGVLAFIEHPEQWERLRDDRSLLPTAVDEILRYTTPIMHFRRTVMGEREVGGQPMQDGEKVIIWYASANYDEDEFADPLRFDVGRTPNQHVTFGGGGPHFCLGANLARLELRVMFDALLDRMPLPELAAPPDRLHSNFNHGLKRMPVRWKV
ncbi:MAG: cytochrome P450 [Actinobacteria bacterium]|nr:cytochrome P450 [Actinomycetota bacterium]